MGKDAVESASVSIHSVEGPWTPNQSRTWGNDVVETTPRNWSSTWTWGLRNRWTSARRTMHQAITPALQSFDRTMRPALNTTWSFICLSIWPVLLRILRAKKQWSALVLFLLGAVLPMVMLGWFTPHPSYPFGSWPPYYNVFAAKSMRCGNAIDYNPVNSTVTGFEGLFVLDETWGKFSFSTVKIIDVAWDILVGRGVQLLAWWTAYIVFSDALLCVIERHPASFRIFQRIALEGPSLHSLWTLCKELLSSNSKRTKTLFTYILLSTMYVLCIPLFLGAMTGYDSTTIAWLDPDDSNNIVPTSALQSSWVITGTWNSTFDKAYCAPIADEYLQREYLDSRTGHCSCQMPNGTLAPKGTFQYSWLGILFTNYGSEQPGTVCLYNYPGATGTWEETEYDSTAAGYGKNFTHNCNETKTYKVFDNQYDIQNLNGTSNEYCYNGKAYDLSELQGKSRCLPDTANPSYQWGFSTMMSGVFVFIHFAWCVSMYIVWLDAQSKSTLVQEGYEVTPLRAAFAIAKAVKRRTGLGEKQLVRHDTKDLNKELYGSGKEKGTKIDYSIFVMNTGEDADSHAQIRRRRAAALDGLPS